MSGGAAYVLDEDGTFRSRCSLGMVELLPVDNDEDQRALRLLVQRHQQYTESAVAARLLARWDDALRRFVKVMPTEYRKVLELMHLDSETMRLASI
jgi:glutamate synthase domain-containing protein 3